MRDERAVSVELTNMCMVVHDGMVLVQDRNDRDWPGIVFPGGHVEQLESVTESVIREVYEETGLRVTDPKLVAIQDWEYGAEGRYMVFLFKATRFEGELRSSSEGSVRWIPLAELKKEDMANGFDKIYRLYEDESLSEMYHPLDAGWNAKYF